MDTAAAYGTAENIIGRVFLRNKNFSKMDIVSKLEPGVFDNANSNEWKIIAVKRQRKAYIG